MGLHPQGLLGPALVLIYTVRRTDWVVVVVAVSNLSAADTSWDLLFSANK